MNKKMLKISVFLMITGLFFFFQCGDDESNDGTDSATAKNKAIEVNGVVQPVVSQAINEAMSSVGTTKSRAVQTFEDTGSLAGTDGGSVTFSYNGTYDSALGTYNFSMTYTFNSYISAGITLNGSLTLTYSGDQNTFNYDVDGTINFTGSNIGTGSITYDYTMSATQNNFTFSGTITVVYEGSSYTYDLSEIYSSYANQG